MDRYQLTNAKNLIHGYFFPTPLKPGGAATEFHRAQQECIMRLEQQLENVKAITQTQFFSKTQ